MSYLDASMAQPPIQLPGYVWVESLYKGTKTWVYRAKEESSGRSVVIKYLCQDYPSLGDLTQFRNQYTITQDLSIPGVVKPFGLESLGNSYALIMEDVGSISLAHYIEHIQQPHEEQPHEEQPDGKQQLLQHQENQRSSLTLIEVLGIALQLTEILHPLHQAQVIHKDIKPANILIHPDSKRVSLIDFSIASRLPKEKQVLQTPENLEGTLAYLAPEQTGRMNRGIDYRADFYSLGVTLYQLLTRQLPFVSEDPLALIHGHIAKAPVPVYELNPNLPKVVSDIVAKLMAKAPEARYQSALGLQHDLKRCLEQWKDQSIVSDFSLGEKDVSDRFLVPEKLYGREAAVQQLLDAFTRSAQGSTELMLVAGLSGIGKTAVVDEIHKPIVSRRGYFIKGKFDQLNRNIPFSAFVQAFQSLVGQLLSESDTEIQIWKAKLLDALGENAQVMIDFVPALENILGPQPAVQDLSGTAAQNRFNLLFQNFISVFAAADHPLVIFVDDLQWADSASLNLVELLMAEAPKGNLLMIGAYRDNEVFPAHPLMVTLNEIEKSGAIVNTISLSPLDNRSLTHLLSDMLHVRQEELQPLVELVVQKTKGNPFFVRQFLQVLHEEQLIAFDYGAGCWQYNLEQLQAAALTDNVIEFVALQLKKLPDSTQQVLKLAACIGAQFDLKTLATVSEKSQSEVAASLWPALQGGFLLPTNEGYKYFQDAIPVLTAEVANPGYRFLHDRVQQAAYSLISEEQKSAVHYQIGSLMWQGCSANPSAKEDKLFDLVNQLNLGREAIVQADQQGQLASLNLQAAQKAKLSAAYEAAQAYCDTGISLLSAEAWNTDYALIYALYYHGSESAYLSSHFDQAEAWYKVALQYAKTPLDKAAIYRVQVTQYQFQGRNSEAIAIQRQSTQLLGWIIPTEPEQIQASLDAEIATVTQFLEQQPIASILEHPKMTDASIEELLRILQILFYAAWLDGQPTLALLGLAKMTTLSLQYGNSEMSPFGYVGYGLIANVILNNADQAYQFGITAVQLCEQFENADVSGMTNFFFAADVHSWKRPLKEADQYYEKAYKYSMDAGNWLTVSFIMMLGGSDRLTYGKSLEDLYEILQSHVLFLEKIKSLENLDALRAGVLQPVRQLLGLTASVGSFDDELFSEAEYLEKYRETPYHLAWFYSVKIRNAYLFGQVEQYAELIPKASYIESTVPTHAKHPSTVLYVLLMHLSLLEKSSTEKSGVDNQNIDIEQAFDAEEIQSLEDKLDRWQQDCPENVRHKYLLFQAEKSRLLGKTAEALDFYDQSIAEAHNQGYLYEEALANELAAKFYLDWGKTRIAADCMREAYYCYARWGAQAKVTDLETRYPQLLAPILRQTDGENHILNTLMTISAPAASAYPSTSTSTSRVNESFDMAAVLKASQLLSSTMQIDDLLYQLTDIILTNSGGDRCALILPESADKWYLRALATSEDFQLCVELLQDSPQLPLKLIQYVKNIQKMVAIDDLKTSLPVLDDYLTQHQPKSILCLPLINQGHLVGILYLENNLASGVFSEARISVLTFLCTQAAISLENSRLYGEVQQSLTDLQNAQLQLVQSEKMSALGNLVAGVAHEINNPVGCIIGNVSATKNYVNDLLHLLDLYEEELPEPSSELAEELEDIDLDYVRNDLPQLIRAMKDSGERIKTISKSLRTFSRSDTEEKQLFNLNEGLESTLLILRHRLKPNEYRPEIEVVSEYAHIPDIACFPGQLNQVFMNILANAIDALDEVSQQRSFADNQVSPNRIIVRTEADKQQIKISIADNGPGMPASVKEKIFDNLFTTKAAGKGTGLGLAIARQIIVDAHGGSLSVNSEVGKGTEFCIQLPR